MNYARLTYNTSKQGVQVSLYHPFFEGKTEIGIKIKEDEIIFFTPGLDYRGKIRKIHRVPKSLGCQTSLPKQCKTGKFYFSEDSTDDELILLLTDEEETT